MGSGIDAFMRRRGRLVPAGRAGAPLGPGPGFDGVMSPASGRAGSIFSAFEVITGWLVTSRWWHATWAAMVLALTFGSVLFSRAHHDTAPAVALTLGVAGTVALVLLRRWRFAAIATVAAVNGVFVVASRLPWPPTNVLCWLVALAAAPVLLSRRASLTILALTEVAVLAGACMPASVNTRPWDTPITEASVAIVVWAGAMAMSAWREEAAERVKVAAQVLDLRERDAAARVRVGIARELHDVVAHHVSLIAVRAATAGYQIDGLPAAANEAFDEIAGQARTALNELRAVLGILRGPESEALQTPQPGLADIAALLARMRGSGVAIEVRTRGTPSSAVTDAVQLCCYRVVQEALTNATRHAPGSPVHLDIHHGPHVEILISNLLTEPNLGSAPTNGFGLIGMRERVTALGGDIGAGVVGAQFRVHMRVPLTARDKPTTADVRV